MKKGVIAWLAAASVVGALSGCVAYVPGAPVVVAPQGGPGNGFCPPGQAKKGNC
ncbi:putative lipoprotein [Burkholderia multivorans CGD2]|uniref:Putative lipoprotein n=1 Tax=Burkholderia multivorans CGD2 TaxID=513052 RepID=B9BY95_9BURK|nr:putative lipoprotein [Burkholderia multivorans CGD2]